MMTKSAGQVIERFRHARREEHLAVLEGFHSVKHAMRFGAQVLEVVGDDRRSAVGLARELAPDVLEQLARALVVVDTETFKKLSPHPPATGVIAIAKRRTVSAADLLATGRTGPLVLLESPTRLGNVGAVIRVAAALGARGVMSTGPRDPWDPEAIRGSAGLHYAVPVVHWNGEIQTLKKIVAVDPDGEELRPGLLPRDAILTFGTEREGLSESVLRIAEWRVGIPMTPGVSSINLATAVAITLYALRFPGNK